ncbi:hypothetical protein LXM50_09475 [Microbacterium sp. Au-Mic1]|uniref:hypothetical protein n=1 Tax=Microbacterium sp. Au-Mic1 TaxID=2906457 RepID=UPI001E63749D|nr:hypothetical protein [Microbacterium sp. Au-Mic1]MCE4026204.1 hypothetical protein [Microbacterium sp. Au-Mic1]
MTAKDGWSGRSRKKALNGRAPLLLLHRSYQNSSRLPELADHLARIHGDALGLGTVIRLPRISSKKASEVSRSFERVPVRIVDPELWRGDCLGWPGAKELTATELSWNYIRDVPVKPGRLWIKSVLDLQEDYDASVLLSPTGWVSEANGAKSLQRALATIDEARSLRSGQNLWANLTLDSKWLTDASLRNTLIDELVESDLTDWYLRFWWPDVSPRYGQLQEATILTGYRDLVRAAALEDRRLYLPNSGLTGWLMGAIGAAGFSTGQAWDEQAFAAQRIVRRSPGQKPTPRIPRYFDSTLLHTVEFSEHERLTELSGHLTLETPYSREVSSGGHTPERASLHYLAAVADLVASTAGKRRANRTHARVKAAREFIKSLDKIDQPTGINSPSHLTLWPKMLR